MSNRTRQAILAAALELFTDRGYTATRFEDIASLAGVSRGSIWNHFRTKERLLDAVVRDHYSSIGAAMGAAARAITVDGPGMLHEVLDAYIDAVDDRPRFVLLLHELLRMVDGPKEGLSRYVEVLNEAAALVEHHTNEPPVPAAAVVDVVVGAVVQAHLSQATSEAMGTPRAINSGVNRRHLHALLDVLLGRPQR